MIDIDFDCIKDIMNYLQDHLGYEPDGITKIKINWTTVCQDEFLLETYTENQIRYNLEQLYRQGYLVLSNFYEIKAKAKIITFIICDFTPEGHALLDNMQNLTVWKKTKEKLKPLGNVAFDVFTKVLAAVATEMIKATIAGGA